MVASDAQLVSMLERWFAFGVLLALLFSFAHVVNEEETTAPPIAAPLDEDGAEKAREPARPQKPSPEEKKPEPERRRGLLQGLVGEG